MAKSTHEIARKGNEKPLCTNIALECKLIAGTVSQDMRRIADSVETGRIELSRFMEHEEN